MCLVGMKQSWFERRHFTRVTLSPGRLLVRVAGGTDDVTNYPSNPGPSPPPPIPRPAPARLADRPAVC
ncbi:hypothetical protein EVAR_58820_1 [Eumeta japonica]|uniref:Uncharacterized protein n=1 Tax=Eumeta variegata TaxID=151549 RepID=A0A4C1YMW5_EUMVA|nr:hypothetical protein EVAR_58820_1 [Eumeta japonica]